MKISIHESSPHSAVSFYRSIGTFSYLPKLNKNISLKIPKQISWPDLIDSDILYMERPQHKGDVQSLEMAKDFNIKTWVDYDDLLHEIPKYNPHYEFYRSKPTTDSVEKAISIADVVTVSTPEIKKYYEKFNKNIKVLPNAFNNYNYKLKYIKQSEYTDPPLVTWRGSETHRKDLMAMREALINIDKKYKDRLSFCFIGNDAWFIAESLKNKTFLVKECDVIDYNQLIGGIRASIHLSPLEINLFNKAKSNIGYLEATYMGAVTIAPRELPEFNVPGCNLYSTEKNNFDYILEKCIKSKSFRQENYDKAYEHVKNNLLLSDINKKRIEIAEELLD